jgi:hypothetical protein
MKSIDSATPADWDRINRKKDWAWMDALDDEPNDHPVYGEPAEKRMIESYDNVHKPEHYNNGGMECIDAIKGMLTHDEYIGYLRGNALKYQWRFRYKGKPVEDLRKARWYEERLISYMLEHPSDK